SPSLLLIDYTVGGLLCMVITATIGMIGLATAVEGWYFTAMSWWERIMSALAGLLLIDPGLTTDMVGFSVLALISLYQYKKYRTNKDSAVSAVAELALPAQEEAEL
ncbi:MAG TPA: DUF3394 domain-containing protein, partial [Syntrophobacteraceae bacterium]|nr:DUF3394 domain-containing protein [Syntrophobacteraceae bacterium]